ncbi:MAG: O-acetyl-ADP-ribose deacetylase [Verrucomicrobia bacterium]|nr:MAG: O-acetyl-ADP-ribose deacetylase [Verrucomicrobiota bacterium]
MKNSEGKIDIVRGDITALDVDAIVNAANTTLLGGGGVDGAIHRAAGPELLAECRTLGGCEVGKAKITRGYKLPARFIIHTVGPVWSGGGRGEAEVLASCYRNSLQLAVKNGSKTIAFPAISCGAYRYPVSEAAQIAVKTTRKFLASNDKIDKVIFVITNDEILEAYQRLCRT